MKQIKCIKYIVVLSFIFQLTACSQDFLDVKPQKQQVILKTLQDVGALLDNASIMNRTDYYRLISDGDFSYSDAKVLSLSEVQRNLYLWKVDIDPIALNTTPWDLPYQQIMYTNIALETLMEMKDYSGNKNRWNELYATAQFYRAWAYYQLLQDFSPAYDDSLDEQLGVPIVTNSLYPKNIQRESLRDGYQFILEQLKETILLLPEISMIKTRPSAQASYGLIARVYLNLGDFEQALNAVDQALKINATLLDYNKLAMTGALPFSEYNFSTHPEVVFFTSSNVPLVAITGIQVSDQLHAKYPDEDLRKKMFFNNERLYTGTYSGNSQYHFTGLAIDELYLIKAECLIRSNRLVEAKKMMEDFLKNRFLTNTNTTVIPDAKDALLHYILTERQKELVGRGTRWTDLKRLNKNGDMDEDLVRIYNGEQFTLPANSKRYVFAIPLEEVQSTELEQNDRN